MRPIETMTTEDTAIWLDIILRTQGAMSMLVGDVVDYGITLELVEDTMYNVWSEQQRAEDELLDQQRWDEDEAEFMQEAWNEL